MVDFLRESLQEMDETITEMRARRQTFAMRLAAIEASTNPAVQAAAADYEARVRDERPYENAEPASDLLSEAHRRYVP